VSERERPRIGVISFPGTCDDRDALRALELTGAEPVRVWHRDTDPPALDGALVPGGFSYGDYLRPGAIARLSPAMDAVRQLAADGRPVLGICNGFQVLCEAGLLPGVLRPNHAGRFVARDVDLRVEQADSPWLPARATGDILRIPIKHHDGAWTAPDDVADAVEAAGQVLLRYVSNPNGSRGDVAAVTNVEGNVLGLMPHPEHAVDALLGSTDGRTILHGLIALAAQPVPVAA
jgi:phosphoribosylformylglycinamidine synthase subunit PurQ / glutaminase